MTSRWPPHGFISDSSREVLFSPKKFSETKSPAPLMGFLSEEDEIPLGPRAMKVSKTGEKEIVPYNDFLIDLVDGQNPFYSIETKPCLSEDCSRPTINSKRKMKKHRSNTLKKRSMYTNRKNQILFAQQQPLQRRRTVNMSTQTEGRIPNYGYVVRRHLLENIGDASKCPTTTPRSSLLLMDSWKFSFAELRSLFSILTLLLLIYWVLSIYFEITFPLPGIVRVSSEYIQQAIKLGRKKQQPKTKVEILVEYLKRVFGY